MKKNTQTQNQRNESNNSQRQKTPVPVPQPHPSLQKSKDLEKDVKSSDEKDTETDEREPSDMRIGKAHHDEPQPMQKPKDNEGWQTGDSEVPENASDNPNT